MPQWISTRDIVASDIIRWSEKVYPPYTPGKTQRPLGERTIVARVTKDSYGAAKQQHTFSLRVISATGYDAPKPSVKLLRKGRVLYRGNPSRVRWPSSMCRQSIAAEKHQRGNQARSARDKRREDDVSWA